MFLEMYFLKKIYNQKLRLRHTIKEVYLTNDGEFIELYYLNQAVRKFRKDPISQYFFIPSIKSPSDDESSIYLSGEKIPESYPYQPNGIGFSWVKYYRENTQFFYIPKTPSYCNFEVLFAALSGKIIDTNPKYISKLKKPIKDIVEFGKE